MTTTTTRSRSRRNANQEASVETSAVETTPEVTQEGTPSVSDSPVSLFQVTRQPERKSAKRPARRDLVTVDCQTTPYRVIVCGEVNVEAVGEAGLVDIFNQCKAARESEASLNGMAFISLKFPSESQEDWNVAKSLYANHQLILDELGLKVTSGEEVEEYLSFEFPASFDATDVVAYLSLALGIMEKCFPGWVNTVCKPPVNVGTPKEELGRLFSRLYWTSPKKRQFGLLDAELRSIVMAQLKAILNGVSAS